MQKNSNRNKKIQKGIVFAGLSAVILVVSTFAWFIGRQEVSVNEFNVHVSAIEHLQFSLNGVAWSDTIDITNNAWTAFDATNASSVYDDHTNSWGSGLVPVSTNADIDLTSSRMTVFDKSSFTRTAGGFKVLSERIDNFSADADEASGIVVESEKYVVFDLFVKNSSGTQYFEAYNPTQEEEIFLTYNSQAVVDATGSAEQLAAGVENSIRVAFLQIARVAGTTTDQDTITGLDCAGTSAGSTAICQVNRNVIWEPNDTDHNAEALGWFADNCSDRVGDVSANLLDPASYDTATACTAFEADTYYPTNVVHTAIPTGASVDIYDGFNGQVPNATYVTPLNTFTDTERDIEGDARNPFMHLAPNSITKVRIYIYLEGMDFDNQDLAEVDGTAITVNFGFTKQQYETSTDNDGTLDNGWATS